MGSVNVARTGIIGDVPEGDGQDSDFSPSWNYLGLAVSRRRITVFFAVIAVGLILAAARVFQMQVLEGSEYSRRAEGNRIRTELVPSERGVIYDRNGRELVRNIPRFDLAVVPNDLPSSERERRQVILRLSEITGLGPVELEDRMAAAGETYGNPVTVSEDLTHRQAVLVSIEGSRVGAVRLVIGTRRFYADTDAVPSLSHLLGYTGRVDGQDAKLLPKRSLADDRIGKTGLERFYEADLRGEYGQRLVEVDALGRNEGIVSEEDGHPGKSLVLSLDLEAQEAAEAFLREALETVGAERGSVVVMNPKDGGIVAMVSWPAFDANLFSLGISQEDYVALKTDTNTPLFNRAIAASLPSGSTFKPVVAAAALEEGTVTKNTTVMSVGGISIGQWRFPDWKAGGHGLTEVTKAIAESVNTYFYAIGGGWGGIEGLGVERIVDYAGRFGFGKETGVDLPGENDGLLPSKEWKEVMKGEPWYIGDTYHLSIGQGDLLVTPLQVAAMTAVFANGGRLVSPRMVTALIGENGDRREIPPKIRDGQVVGEASLDIVRQGMRRTVTDGSARSFSWLPVEVAAKTGTAQWNRNRRTHAWFTSFAPYDDPELVVTVIVEEGGDGSAAAAPVARRFYEWWYSGRPPIGDFGQPVPELHAGEDGNGDVPDLEQQPTGDGDLTGE